MRNERGVFQLGVRTWKVADVPFKVWDDCAILEYWSLDEELEQPPEDDRLVVTSRTKGGRS